MEAGSRRVSEARGVVSEEGGSRSFSAGKSSIKQVVGGQNWEGEAEGQQSFKLLCVCVCVCNRAVVMAASWIVHEGGRGYSSSSSGALRDRAEGGRGYSVQPRGPGMEGRLYNRGRGQSYIYKAAPRGEPPYRVRIAVASSAHAGGATRPAGGACRRVCGVYRAGAAISSEGDRPLHGRRVRVRAPGGGVAQAAPVHHAVPVRVVGAAGRGRGGPRRGGSEIGGPRRAPRARAALLLPPRWPPLSPEPRTAGARRRALRPAGGWPPAGAAPRRPGQPARWACPAGGAWVVGMRRVG